jgi:GTP pyrophosphokinase
VQQFKRAALDDTIYVLTPQDKVIDLPRGATPLDFAYRLHTDLGHRCRGAKVDGHMTFRSIPPAERPARGDCQHQERRSVA